MEAMMLLRESTLIGACAMGAILACSAPASADIIYQTGNEQYYNVNIAADTNANTVTGAIGNTGDLMTFNTMVGPYPTQTSPYEMHCQHGVAFCESYADSLVSTSSHTGFSSLTLSALGGTAWSAGDLALDLLGSANGTVSFQAYFNGTLVPLGGGTNSFAIDATGQNTYNFYTINGEAIDELVITSSSPFNLADIKAVSLQPTNAPIFVPEPSSLLLLGTGLLGIGWFGQRRRTRA